MTVNQDQLCLRIYPVFYASFLLPVLFSIWTAILCLSDFYVLYFHFLECCDFLSVQFM